MSLLKKASLLFERRQVNGAYWQVLYRTPQKISGDQIVSEWDCSWEDLPREGKIAARLVCANNQLGVLEFDGIDMSDRLFQFKIAKAQAGLGRITESYVLGAIREPSGLSVVWAWESLNNRLVGPFEDYFPNMTYGGPVTHLMDSHLLGVRE